MSSSFTPSAKKILGITFLSLVLVVATYVVTSGKFNMNPNKKAYVCPNDCTTDSDCSSGQYCSIRSTYGETCGECKTRPSSTPTPSTPKPTPTKSPTPKPRTPTPTACPLTGMTGGGVCETSQKGNTQCGGKNTSIIKCDGRCWIIIENCSAQDKECDNSSTPTCVPHPVDYSYNSYLITSGTCSEKCRSVKGFCEGVSTYTGEMNNKIMSWTDWSFCQKRAGNCGSTIKQLTSNGLTTCGGYKPEWTYCHCKIPIN